MMDGDPTNPEQQSWGGRFVRFSRTSRVGFKKRDSTENISDIA
jgi:hypothetical protein